MRLALVVLSLVALLASVPARAQDDDFNRWLEQFKDKARAEGIRNSTLDAAFDGLTPDDEVVRLDQKQPEKKITLTRYLQNTITPRRVEKARRMMEENRTALTEVSRRYGVQPQYIVALWAIESDFGNNKGNFSVVQSLATLAYEGRRAEFFGKELIAALKIIENENIRPDELTGSWAGAMGDCQFMPSTFLRHAVDGNNDGHRDIWNTNADIFASVANYLHSLGWNAQAGWGHRVNLPAHFNPAHADIKVGKPNSYWRKQGMTYYGASHKKLPQDESIRYAMYPGAEDEGVYLVTENYKALLQWNRSRYFATAVGKLADAIGD